MPEQKSEIIQRQLGFSWSLSIERERRTDTGSRYPDKDVIQARVSGNCLTYTGAIEQLRNAKAEIEKLLREA
jgi:hypothetical protein